MLTFALLTPKTVGIFHSIRAIIPRSWKVLGQIVPQLSSKICFHIQGYCDFDLCPTEPQKSIEVFYLIRATILWGIKALKWHSSYLARAIFRLKLTVTLTFDKLIPKTIGFFRLIRAIIVSSLKVVSQTVLKLLNWNKDGQMNRAKTVCLVQSSLSMMERIKWLRVTQILKYHLFKHH